MTVKRRARQALGLPADLNLAHVDMLLDGALRSPADAPDGYDSFLEFDVPGPDWPALWRTHRAALLAEWTRRGGAGQPWGAQFDAPGA